MDEWDREEDSPQSKLERIEEKLENLESEVNYIKENMLTLGKLTFWVLFIIVFALWGDKIWEFIKWAFIFIIGSGVVAYEEAQKISPSSILSLVFGCIILIWGVGVAIEGYKKIKGNTKKKD